MNGIGLFISVNGIGLFMGVVFVVVGCIFLLRDKWYDTYAKGANDALDVLKRFVASLPDELCDKVRGELGIERRGYDCR